MTLEWELKLILLDQNLTLNPGPADPRYTLPLQTV